MEESPSLSGATTGAVFLSYASEDAAAAKTICEALRAAGVEVWLDQSELRGGDAWDQAIRRQIRTCALFLPIISKHTHRRAEGYFRLEWKLGVDRSYLIAAHKAFLVPVVIDETEEEEEHVPERFKEVQWTRLPGGATPRSFVTRIQQLLSAEPARTGRPRSPARSSRVLNRGSRWWFTSGILLALAALTAILIVEKPLRWPVRSRALEGPVAAMAPESAELASVSQNSVAVLPFVDMSEKRDQEYFSDGLSEELIDLLSKIPDLRVPARTSSFYFKGKTEDVRTIARRLLVAHVLEGSVRKSGNHLRVTAQLVRADNGYHLWSQTYERKLDDIFRTQDEIAGAVVKALKVSLLTGGPPDAQLTTSSEAYDLYLQARASSSRDTSVDTLNAYAALRRAVALDPKFTLAWASLADILSKTYADWFRVFSPTKSSSLIDVDPLQDWQSVLSQLRTAAHKAADQAVANGPGLADGHLAMGQVLARFDSDWPAADAQLKLARELEPGNARVLLEAAELAIDLGRGSEGLQLAQRAAAMDPLGSATFILAWGRYVSGALDEAQSSLQQYIELYPTASRVHYRNALLLLARRQPEAALTEVEHETLSRYRQAGLPLALDALGRHEDADQALQLSEQRDGNAMAYQIAYVYVGRRNFERALDWLERAYRQGDPGMRQLKVDPMFTDLRGNPRYQALLQKMRLPE